MKILSLSIMLFILIGCSQEVTESNETGPTSELHNTDKIRPTSDPKTYWGKEE